MTVSKSRRLTTRVWAMPLAIGTVALSLTACQASDVSATGSSTTSSTAQESSTEAVDVATSVGAVTGAGEWQLVTFTDPEYGNQQLTYNLFLPANYDAAEEYPLVLFMEDASLVGTDMTTPIDQGEGAVVWASEESQSDNPAIVIAPQYTSVVLQDDYNPNDDLDITVNLVEAVAAEYSVDENRIYNTGQSMGGMMTIGMDIKYPDVFAASYIVAAQWPAEYTAPLADQNIWYTVAEGDTKAYPGMQQIRDEVEGAGGTVTGGMISAQASTAEFGDFVADLVARNAGFNYTVFEARTDLGKGAGMEHMGTWDYAYGIQGIRDWLFAQTKSM